MTRTTTTPRTCATLPDLVRTRADEAPDRLQYRTADSGGELTVSQVVGHAESVAAGLQGLEAGDRVVLLLPPGGTFAVAFFGAMFAGVVAVPVAPPGRTRLTSGLEPLRRIAADCRPSAVVTTEAMAEAIRPVIEAEQGSLTGVQILAIEDLVRADADAAAFRERGTDDPAYLQYTSGSTSTPRGVVITHGNVTTNAAAIAAAYRTTPEDHAMVWVPPHHDMGLVGGLLTPLTGGFSVTLWSPYQILQSPIRWLESIHEERVTISGGPDFGYRLAADRVEADRVQGLDLRSWRLAFTGAEPISAATIDAFAERFGPAGFDRFAFYPCYGLAETTLMATGGIPGEGARVRGLDRHMLEAEGRAVDTDVDADGTRRLVSCGRPIDADHDLRIVDVDSGLEQAEGTVGEIWFRGPSVAHGYHDDPQSTEVTFRASFDDRTGPFLRTGDLGVVIDGELYVTGRRKDVIVVNGRNIDAHDVEEAVRAVVDAPRKGQTAAISILESDRERFVVVQEVGRGAADEAARIVRDVQGAVARRFGVRADEVLLVRPGSVPTTTSGKIRRAETARLVRAGALTPVEGP